MPAGMPDANALGRACAHLAGTASFELLPGATDQIPELARLLPVGTRIFVPHLPGPPLGNGVPTLAALRAAGFEPVAHVAARRIASRSEFGSFMEAASTAGVREILALGGDLDPPAGPFKEAADLLAADMILGTGIRAVHFGAYPDAHPRITVAALAASMQRKFDLAARLGIAARIVTQFSFEPENVAALARRMPAGSQVRLGIAGPCAVTTLMRYARLCGVGNSLRAVANLRHRCAATGRERGPDGQPRGPGRRPRHERGERRRPWPACLYLRRRAKGGGLALGDVAATRGPLASRTDLGQCLAPT